VLSYVDEKGILNLVVFHENHYSNGNIVHQLTHGNNTIHVFVGDLEDNAPCYNSMIFIPDDL